MSTHTTFLDAFDAVRDHLAGHALPDMASVQLHNDFVTGSVTAVVQLGAVTLTMVARGLLVWADTLTDVSVTAWRVPAGTTVHAEVSGRLPGGTAVKVYGGIAYNANIFGTDLASDCKETISLGVVRAAAALDGTEVTA